MRAGGVRESARAGKEHADCRRPRSALLSHTLPLSSHPFQVYDVKDTQQIFVFGFRTAVSGGGRERRGRGAGGTCERETQRRGSTVASPSAPQRTPSGGHLSTTAARTVPAGPPAIWLPRPAVWVPVHSSVAGGRLPMSPLTPCSAGGEGAHPVHHAPECACVWVAVRGRTRRAWRHIGVRDAPRRHPRRHPRGAAVRGPSHLLLLEGARLPPSATTRSRLTPPLFSLPLSLFSLAAASRPALA